ncbi:MAG TPA: hypothetical protein PKC18_10150, partial [Lacipirellulaceae bacterium]|nr:hypothetical protein [Lacipirellulaceae bacterium]
TSATVSNFTICNTQIDDGFSGIAYNREASATSRLTLNNVTINNTAGVGLDIDVAGTADANISIINGTSVTNMNNLEAMTFNTTGGANKTVRLLIDGSEFTNNSAAAHTVNLNLAGTGTINANITDNAFNNGGGATGRAFVMSSNSPGTLVRLNLDNNNATSANANAYRLQESTGDFDIVDRATANARNAGGIEYDPNEAAFDDIPGPVPQPQ